MATKELSHPSKADTQEVCIDLPGEAVQCWRSSDNIKVVLRKHRDVIFDINLQGGSKYTVESKCDFYCPRDKKLLRKVEFIDGEVLNVWVGREFKGVLELKSNGRLLGTYTVNQLDTTAYGTDPKTKPEPLMVIMGQRNSPSGFKCTLDDPLGVGWAQLTFKPDVDPKLATLSAFGSRVSYQLPEQLPEIQEYVAVTEAQTDEINPQVVRQLERDDAVVGTVDQIFVPPKGDANGSPLYRAFSTAAPILTGNLFKEAAGYLQENFRQLHKFGMMVRIEKKTKGKYRVALKGRTLNGTFGNLIGAGRDSKITHHSAPMGGEETKFIDGGFSRSGKAGFGGVRRMFLTTVENFKGGLKVQVVGTIIDWIVDANTVFIDEKGSKDISEFLGRAGVSLVKAGVTAALGGLFVSGFMAGLAAASLALPVVAVVVVAIGLYFVAAYFVDQVDDQFQIKERVANAVQ
jgi:hypothetical protein